jgi:hypothetical protein
LNSGAMSIRAVIDARKQEGLIFYELEVAIDEAKYAAVVRSVKDKFGKRLWSMKNPSTGVVVISLFSFSLGEPENSVMDTLKIEGVRRCSLFIFKELIEPSRSSWIDALIERKISGLSKANRLTITPEQSFKL